MKFKIKDENNKVVLAYLAVCILWGSTYLAIRIGVGEFPPLMFAGIRFLTAGVLMLGFCYFKGLIIPNKFTDIRKISMVGLFLLLGGNGCVVFAETWVSSGTASLLVATVPLFMAILELIFNKKSKTNAKSWIGLLVGFSGVALLVFSSSNTGAIDIKGASLVLLGAFMWAIGSVYSKSFKAEGSIIAHIAIQMIAAGAGFTIIGSVIGEISKIHVTYAGLGAIIYLIIFGSIIGYSCYIYILKKWPAAKAGTYAYVNPVVAVFLGALVLKEPLNPSIILSAAVILLGVILVQTSKN